jgi:DNA invertase Pin-like site-specific DNA recombinase
MTKAFSYLRVSGLGQVSLDGFPRQRETVQKYADANNIEIVEEFRDEGVPGKTELANRPGLASLLARLETNGVRMVLVEIPDRLARDAVVSELIIREFQKLKATVISCSGGIDLTAGSDDNPTAKLVRQILAAVAEFDRCIIVLKTRAARERLRAKNGRCEGRKPFGTKSGNEAATLSLILDYSRSGMDSVGIAERLNAAGILTRYGKAWNAGTVWKIIERNRRTLAS